MKRNMFGQARPKGADEVIEAQDESSVLADDVNATLEFSDGGTEFDGWTAEVRDNESGDEVFTTLGYADKDALIADLKAAGITDIYVND